MTNRFGSRIGEREIESRPAEQLNRQLRVQHQEALKETPSSTTNITIRWTTTHSRNTNNNIRCSRAKVLTKCTEAAYIHRKQNNSNNHNIRRYCKAYKQDNNNNTTDTCLLLVTICRNKHKTPVATERNVLMFAHKLNQSVVIRINISVKFRLTWFNWKRMCVCVEFVCLRVHFFMRNFRY